jgi:type II secretion system protein H
MQTVEGRISTGVGPVSRARRRAHGFTLIELILVLIILTVIAAVVVPSIRTFATGRDKDNIATMFLSLSDYARTQAASEGRTYRLNLDTTQNALWLTAQDGATFVAPTSDFGQRFTTTTGVTITTDIQQRTDGTYVEFFPGGRSEAAKIWVTDKQKNTTEVAAASATELFRIVPQAEATK